MDSKINFDIWLNSIPEECMKAYLEKECRFDNRKLYESRPFEYRYKVLNNYEHSAIGSIGLNKILLVLKEVRDNSEENPKINIIIDNFVNNKSTKNLFDFINKLLKDNISYANDIFILFFQPFRMFFISGKNQKIPTASCTG